jgi:hypothetical protein
MIQFAVSMERPTKMTASSRWLKLIKLIQDGASAELPPTLSPPETLIRLLKLKKTDS